MAKTIASINIRIGAVIDKLQQGLKNAEKTLKRSGRRMSRLGDDLSQNISLPLAAIGGIGVKMAADLETSFSKIENLVGVTGQTLKGFKEDISALSTEIGQSQKELSEALFVITSAGERGAEAMEILRQAAKASKIGMGETSEIARAATAVLQSYGKENISASKAIDILTATVREGNLEASSLAPVLGNVVGLAAQLGVSFEEVGANIATFTRLGVSAENAVTGLSALLSGMIKPSEAGSKALAKVNLSYAELRSQIKEKGLARTLNDLLKLFEGNEEALAQVIPNVKALRTALGTAGVQGEEYIKISQSIADSTGIVEKGFLKASESANAQFNKALVSLQNVAINLGNTLLPTATKIVKAFSNIIKSFVDVPYNLDKIALAFAGVFAAIGPVIKIIGVAKLNFAAMTSTALLAVKSLKSLGAAFITLNRTMKATLFGAVAAGIVLAINALSKYNKELTDFEKIQNSLHRINSEAIKNTARERVAIEKLTAKLNENKDSQEARADVINQLKAINPGYFKDLNTEKSKINDITGAMASYIKAIEARAKLTAANNQLIKIEEKLLDTQTQLKENAPGFVEGLFDFAKGGFTVAGFAKNTAETLASSLQKSKASLESQKTALLSYITTLESAQDKGLKTEDPVISATPAVRIDTPIDTGKKINNELTKEEIRLNEILSEKLAAGAVNLERLSNAELKAIENSEALKETLSGLKLNIEEPVAAFNALENILQSVGDTILQTAVQGAKGFKELGLAALRAAADVIRAEIAKAVTVVVGKLLAKTGVLGLLLAPAAGAAAAQLFTGLLGKFGIPGLAEGGLAFAPQLAVVGDNPNARTDPEIIAPLSKLRGYVGNDRNIKLSGVFRIQGRDLVLNLEDAIQEMTRQRGF